MYIYNILKTIVVYIMYLSNIYWKKKKNIWTTQFEFGSNIVSNNVKIIYYSLTPVTCA